MATAMTKVFDEGPWYKQFWAWFILTPLLIVIVAVLSFVAVAVYNADDVVIDNYYKEGRLINQRFEQDKQAVALHIHGKLRFDLELGEVLLTLSGDTELPEKLLLLLNHPTSAARDQQVVLHAITPGRYRGDLERRPQHRWYLRLLPAVEPAQQNNADWRLNGQIDFAATDSLQLGETPAP